LIDKGKEIDPKAYTIEATRRGDLPCLKAFHEAGYEWDDQTTEKAAEFGKIDCLIYAHINGCPWTVQTTIKAAENNHLACLRYAIENGCPMNEIAIKTAVKNDSEDCINYLKNIGWSKAWFSDDWNFKPLNRKVNKDSKLLQCTQNI
jgi:hypothetical protein